MDQIKPLKIEVFPETTLAGMSINTCLAENKTKGLWQSFRSTLARMEGEAFTTFYSVHVYEPGFSMLSFTPQTRFEKWAAVKINGNFKLPSGMDQLVVPGGKYAVFIHKGPVHTFPKTAGAIFGGWLPNSGFDLDDRPHFEILDESYLGPTNPDSVEEVWVPIKEQ